ncbi:thioredoxin family protein [Pareuzebyella sediminis]|uniref:thioredoxin family protein n=1 Tax=Pareuzebyella sediminis TaxID=2607998 RepID=UPI0011F03C87|nr:thioredoxin family protein [Pareuzebyella sediminis]
MKGNFSIIFYLIIATNLYSQINTGIEFSSVSFEEAIKTSKELNRPIFIDFSTSWCGPCRQMDNLVFSDSIIGDFYNKNFICLKFDAEKGEGITLANKFEINAYPTLLFLSPQLETELKHIGYRGPKEFLELGYTVVNEKTADITHLNSLIDDEDIMEFSSFLSAYPSQLEKDLALLDYFRNIPQNKWYAPQFFYLIEDHAHSIFSPLSKLVVENRIRYSEMYGKERIDKFISRLMAFAFEAPKDLYGAPYKNLSDNEINKLLFSELSKIDPVLASKNSLDHEIILLCNSIRENYNNTEIWDALFEKVDYYNTHYAHFDEEWHNFPNNWYYRALKIIPKKLEIKNYNEASLKRAKSVLGESDYNKFEKGLCIGTVQTFVSGQNQSENSKKELTIALRILSKSQPVSKIWANNFLSRIKVSDNDINKYKEEIIKNAL